MPSKAQRAVTGVPSERWALFGRALQAWREDVLGYQARSRFADDRSINLRLVQDLEKNYRPGTYTKWALQDAAQAYKVPYSPEDGPGSVLAFLRGETDTLARASAAPAASPAVIEVPGLPPAPFDDPGREAACRPYAETIWKRFLDLPRSVTDPSGAQMFGEDTPDAKTWDGIGTRLDLPDRVWLIADLQRRDAARAGNAGTGTNGS
jgi:hypothetical protein